MARFATAVALAGLLLAPTCARAGANNADFHCTSAQGKARITLDGNIPGDFASFELTLSDPSGSVAMSDKDHTINVISDFTKGVFTIAVSRQDNRNLLLYALPATVKYSAGPGTDSRASFSAVLLQAPRPGNFGPYDANSMLHKVRLTCSYKYAI